MEWPQRYTCKQFDIKIAVQPHTKTKNDYILATLLYEKRKDVSHKLYKQRFVKKSEASSALTRDVILYVFVSADMPVLTQPFLHANIFCDKWSGYQQKKCHLMALIGFQLNRIVHVLVSQSFFFSFNKYSSVPPIMLSVLFKTAH